MIVHGIWVSSVMVGDAGGEGVKPSVNFHGDRCGAVWCNGLDVGCLVVWSSVLIVLPAKIIFFVGIIEDVFSEQFLSYVSVDGIACVVAVGGGALLYFSSCPTIFTSGSALPSLFRKPAPVAVVRLTFL